MPTFVQAPWLLTLLLVCPLSLAANQADVEKDKRVLIQELVRMTGAAAQSEQYAQAFSQQLVSVLRISNPNLSVATVSIVEDEVNQTIVAAFNSESLQEQIYPIYAKYFTLEELESLLEFNRSPAGQKANQVMPLLIAESNAAAQVWAKALFPEISTRVLRRLRKEGIEIQLPDRQAN